MLRASLGWVAFWTTFGFLDYAADRRGKSLSESSRWVFRTHTPAGRAAFTVVYGTGAMVLHRHVLKAVAQDAVKAET